MLAKLRKQQLRSRVGDTAYVGSQGLGKDAIGEVTWSGVIERALLAQDCDAELLEAATEVIVTDDLGSKLIVKPKN